MRRSMYANKSKYFLAIWTSKNRRNMLSNMHKAENFAKQFCNNFTDKTENYLSKLNEFMKYVETRDDKLSRSSVSTEKIERVVSALSLSNALDSEKLLHILHLFVCTCYFCMLINAVQCYDVP